MMFNCLKLYLQIEIRMNQKILKKCSIIQLIINNIFNNYNLLLINLREIQILFNKIAKYYIVKISNI